MINKKKSILIIMGRYLPGYKDGGPVRSIKNLVDYFGNVYDFKILTCDRDHGDHDSYPNIKVNDWNRVGNAQVFYVKPKGFRSKLIKNLTQNVDMLYICGCFSDYAIVSLLLKKFRRINVPVVCAAMGNFSPLAFKLKYWKKKTFVDIFNFFGIFDDVIWSATTSEEIFDIKHYIKGRNMKYYIAEDLPRKVNVDYTTKKNSGILKIVWISRITPKKNLLGAIEILAKVKSDVSFTMYGPVHDEEYWSLCRRKLRQLPNNIKYEWKGNVESERVVDVLREYDLFLFPTLGENYGHVIHEALSAGCAVLVSDQTPWNDLSCYKVGYSIPLVEKSLFVEKIEMYANCGGMSEISVWAQEYAKMKSDKSIENSGYIELFKYAE